MRSIETKKELKGFLPIINSDCKILILGSFPSVDSLNRQQYYGNPRNNFWKIIFTLFNEQATNSVENRKTILLKYGIALWDILQTCERNGSSDANIQQEKPNNIPELLEKYPIISTIFFNGTAAHKFYIKYYKTINNSYFTKILPSTSPANASKKFEDILKDWSILKNYIK